MNFPEITNAIEVEYKRKFGFLKLKMIFLIKYFFLSKKVLQQISVNSHAVGNAVEQPYSFGIDFVRNPFSDLEQYFLPLGTMNIKKYEPQPALTQFITPNSQKCFINLKITQIFR